MGFFVLPTFNRVIMDGRLKVGKTKHPIVYSHSYLVCMYFRNLFGVIYLI